VVIAERSADPSLPEAGAWRPLPKPFTASELSALLHGALGSAPQCERLEPSILTRSSRVEELLALAHRVAQTDATVLIQGETGTGKELLARWIHRTSPRTGGPFVAVNCSALPESLIEAELFGHERGAFTGALVKRTGRFEAASGGTLMLDEISEIPIALQPKLLRAIQEREVERVGSNSAVKVDVRVIAATNCDLRSEVTAGRFRKDLFYRLNVISLELPPLRDRAGDILLLSRYFLLHYATAHRSPARGLTPAAVERLLAHSWPGNVRELENVIQRAVILCGDAYAGPEHVVLDEEPATAPPRSVAAPGRTMEEVERELILSTLEQLGGNRTHTARALGLSVRTIRNRLREYRSLPRAPEPAAASGSPWQIFPSTGRVRPAIGTGSAGDARVSGALGR
jgi:DNA-binding NtrC family response regulator